MKIPKAPWDRPQLQQRDRPQLQLRPRGAKTPCPRNRTLAIFPGPDGQISAQNVRTALPEDFLPSNTGISQVLSGGSVQGGELASHSGVFGQTGPHFSHETVGAELGKIHPFKPLAEPRFFALQLHIRNFPRPHKRLLEVYLRRLAEDILATKWLVRGWGNTPLQTLAKRWYFRPSPTLRFSPAPHKPKFELR